jgi:transposase-like protein
VAAAPGGVAATPGLPPEARKAIYTTGATESANGAAGKFTRDRRRCPNAGGAVKLPRLAIPEAPKRWAVPIEGREQALNHVATLSEGRMPAKLNDWRAAAAQNAHDTAFPTGPKLRRKRAEGIAHATPPPATGWKLDDL